MAVVMSLAPRAQEVSAQPRLPSAQWSRFLDVKTPLKVHAYELAFRVWIPDEQMDGV